MRIFLSYNTQDHASADALRRALIERRPGLEICFAPHRNETGAYWIARLDRELEAADLVLLLLGERVGSWQEQEYFETLRRNRRHGRPSLAPVFIEASVPGLPFLDQFQPLFAASLGLEERVEALLKGIDAELTVEPLPPWQHLNPYRGLLPMEGQDAGYFLGRETLTASILTRIAEQPGRVHILVGNSGVGKSSVAQAGVLGALRSQLWPGNPVGRWPEALSASHTWPVVRMRPGAHPLEALSRAFVSLWREDPAEIDEEARAWQRRLQEDAPLSALVGAALSRVAFRMDAEPPERIVLFIDQAEDLYARADARQARRFSSLLAAAAALPELLVLLALRADEYGRLLDDSELFAVTSPVDVAPLDRSALERIVRLPAELLGARFASDEAVEQVVAAAHRQAGALPLLADLMCDIWRDMRAAPAADGVLRLPRGFVDIVQPLADKGERFVAAHPGCEPTLRRLFTLKLAVLPREGEILPRRARRAGCSAEEWALIEGLAAAGTGFLRLEAEATGPWAELAHEAVLRHWPRVAAWLDEAREFLAWRSAFEAEYRAWEVAGELARERTLLSGLRLELARRWLRDRHADLGEGERIFIEDSQRVAAEALGRERRTLRRVELRRRWVLGMAVIALAGASALAVLALKERDQAQEARTEALEASATALAASARARADERQALERADLAEARRLAMAAEGVLGERAADTGLAGLLAVESLARHPTPLGLKVAERVLALSPRAAEALPAPWPNARLVTSRDGRVRVFAGPLEGEPGAAPATELMVLREQDPGEGLRLGNEAALGELRLSPDGARLATLSGAGELALWDTASGERLVHRALGARGLDFSADGARLVVRADGRRILLLDAASGAELGALGESVRLARVRLLPGARTLLGLAPGGRLQAWDARSGRLLRESPWPRPDPAQFELSADGRWFTAPREDGRLDFGESEGGRVLATLPLEADARHLLSGDGRRILVIGPSAGALPGSAAGVEVELRALPSGEVLRRRSLGQASVDARFLPGGRIALLAMRGGGSGEAEGFLEILDAEDGGTLWWRVQAAGPARVLPVGEGALAISSEGALELLESSGGARIVRLEAGALAAALAVDQGARLALAFTAADGSHLLELRAREGGAPVWRVKLDGPVTHLARVDGALFAAVGAAAGHSVRKLGLADGAELGRISTADAPAALLPLAEDELLAIGDSSGEVGVWRAADLTRVHSISHDAEAGAVVVASAAPRALSWLEGSMALWDLAAGTALDAWHDPLGVGAAAISPDGRSVASLGARSQDDERRRLSLWSVGERAPRKVLALADPGELLFDPRGERLALRVGVSELRVFAPEGLRSLARFNALPGGRFVRFGFNSDGSLLLAEEQRDGRSGLRVFTLSPPGERLRIDHPGEWQAMPVASRVALRSGDGLWRLRSLETDGAAALAEIPAEGRLEALVAELCGRIGRELSASEWQRHVDAEPRPGACASLPGSQE